MRTVARWVEQINDDTATGDCFRACLASLTGLDAIPNLIAEDDDWFGAFDRWLGQHDLSLDTRAGDDPPEGLAITTVPSPTYPGFYHALVTFGGRVVWDPSPHRNDPGREYGPARAHIVVLPRTP